MSRSPQVAGRSAAAGQEKTHVNGFDIKYVKGLILGMATEGCLTATWLGTEGQIKKTGEGSGE